MWQLSQNGQFAQINSLPTKRAIHIDPTQKDPLDGLDPLQFASIPEVRINFSSHADGRGFSLAKQFAEQFRSSNRPPKLVAVGKLIPDQARLAFQSGFDFIEIDDEEVLRHSEASWRDALSNAVADIYFQTSKTDHTPANIWAERQKSNAP